MPPCPRSPQGATNFALFASNATAVTLVLFTENDLHNGRVTTELPLNAATNRTGAVWHVMLPNLDPALLYGFRVAGPNPAKPDAAKVPQGADIKGQAHDPSKVLLDPYATAVISRRRYGQLGPNLEYNTPRALGLAPTWTQHAGVLPQPGGESAFDWQGDRPLNLPMESLVIYEAHVRGFTASKSSGVESPGTYEGMVERLPYLAALGINALELLPVQEFNELEYYSPLPGVNNNRLNYWGYSTVGYFAPMSRYSAAVARGARGDAACNELKLLVREAHKLGIEVILDVVFNHTAEVRLHVV